MRRPQMKAERTNSKLGGMTVVATMLTVFLSLGMASAAEFHAPGLDCTDCHDMSGSSANISVIKEIIDFRGPASDVTYLVPTDDFARTDNLGVCEACHYATKDVHIDEMEGTPENDDCTSCHGSHCADTPNLGDPGMFSTGAIPDDAGHGLHYAAPGAKMAAALDCFDCHSESSYSLFKDDLPLATTTTCDGCHSPSGADDPVIGAKANWTDGIYESDGVTLKVGKEQWCATCHDDDPAYSQATITTIESVIVDNVPDGIPDGAWGVSTWCGDYNGTNYHYHTDASGTDTFTWPLTVTTVGTYEVFAYWCEDATRATDATYTIYHDGGSTPVSRDQTSDGEWVSLGTYDFDGVGVEKVELAQSADGYVIADAIKLVTSGAVLGAYAPNVIGDNTTYGFYVNGHGGNGIYDCLNCHDAGNDHIDHSHRTYSSGSNPNNYQTGYRLKTGMVVPRPKRNKPQLYLDDFALCIDCHNPDEVIGQGLNYKSHTNFKKDDHRRNVHFYHLSGKKISYSHFDSDFNGSIDSHGSCIACHNVHGAPNQAMIRHGELIDNAGALNFCYLTSQDLGSCNTEALLQESVGSLIDPGGSTVAGNGVCSMGCHSKPTGRNGSEDLFRNPYLGPKVIDPNANPESALADGVTNVLFTAFVFDHNDNVPADGVTIDVSSIGGDPGIETMYDDGDTENSGDEVAGDGIYTYKTTVAMGVSGGMKLLVVTADDPDGLPGEFNISLTVELPPGTGKYLVDNDDPVDATPIGDWGTSGWCSDRIGSDYHYHADASGTDIFIWTPTITVPDTYEVFAYWCEDPTRATDATYTIYHDGGSTLVSRDQTSDGDWVSLGTYNFDGVGEEKVELSQSADGYVIADAMKWAAPEPPPPPIEKLLVDNDDPADATPTGDWGTSGWCSDRIGSDYHYHADASGTDIFTWTPTVVVPETYEVFAYWCEDPTRATDAAYTIYHDGGSTLVSRDQTSDGDWVSLGTYDFDGLGVEKVELSQSADGYVIADAVELVPRP
jgi:hypothetical protein